MKIVAWNIRQGGGSRIHKIAKSLLTYHADILVISEFHNTKSGSTLKSKLKDAGYTFQHSTTEPRKNTVLIASKIDGDFATYYNRIVLFPEGIVSITFEDFIIYGVYLPHKKKHQLFEFLMEEINNEKAGIIIGDYNSGINFLDQKGDSFWYTEYFPKFLEAGYLDAFRVIHDDKKEYSWYSHQGNGFRYDHCWLHKTLVSSVKDCYFSHVERENKISDHSIMVLELDF